jgi:hypothetical protein
MHRNATRAFCQIADPALLLCRSSAAASNIFVRAMAAVIERQPFEQRAFCSGVMNRCAPQLPGRSQCQMPWI